MPGITRLGWEGKVYYNSGTYATPVWNEIKIAKDATLSLKRDKGEVTNRSTKWKKFRVGQIESGLEFEITWNRGTTALYLLHSFLNATVEDMLFTDDDRTVTGTSGFRGFFQIEEFGEDQKMSDGQSVKVALCPTEDPAGANDFVEYTAP